MEGKPLYQGRKVAAPDGYLILAVAEKYHVLPDQVEKMDAYWFERAVEMMRGEHEYTQAMERKRDREQNRRRR